MKLPEFGSIRSKTYRLSGLWMAWVGVAFTVPSILPTALATWLYDRGSYEVSEGAAPLGFWACLQSAWLVLMDTRADIT